MGGMLSVGGNGTVVGKSGTGPVAVEGDEASEAPPVPLWAFEPLRRGSGGGC
jgi:hypothetical protein